MLYRFPSDFSDVGFLYKPGRCWISRERLVRPSDALVGP